ncbi:MAG: hypothetical protein NC418_11605 [Muribaculaceae bacterium]|nr:hypothetical protein [Muribaculaceae bacterium]
MQATEASDSTVVLRDIEVTAGAPATRVHRDGSLHFGAAALRTMPRTLGEADALNYVKLLPGINTISDYSSGVAIDGMNYANNMYTLNGIPVYFPYHFGGFFSTFNPVLYPKAAVEKSARGADAPDCLGGIVAVSSESTQADSIHADINVGMIASTIALELPVSKNLTIAAAARASYLNLFYGDLLGGHNTKIDYNYYDTDLNMRWQVDPSNTITGTFHHNADKLNYRQTTSTMLTAMRWHNTLGGITWASSHSGYSMSHRIFHSSFANRLGMTVTDIGVHGRNSFAGTGIAGSADIYLSDALTLSPAYSAELYRYLPQRVSSAGVGSGNTSTMQHLRAALASTGADIRWRKGILESSASAKVSHYRGPHGYSHTTFDPALSLMIERRRWSASISAGTATQFVHQTGFSEIGMASNFKLCADSRTPPERIVNLSATGTYRPARGLALTADVFYKIIRRQPEYRSSILELTSAGYDPVDYITPYDGHNIGGSVMAAYSSRKVDATASYSYCRALRHPRDGGPDFTASTELRHSVKANGVWRISPHWEVNGIFTLASGRPYTPITAVYMVAGRIMLEYGERNSANMPPYHRLDLGAAYTFSTGGRLPLRHRIDLAVLNVYARRNIEIYAYAYHRDGKYFRRREIGSLMSTLPSLSYTITF